MEKRRVEEIGVDAVEAAKQVFQNNNGSGSILGVFFGHGLKGFLGKFGAFGRNAVLKFSTA